jgi:hypothetical protein
MAIMSLVGTLCVKKIEQNEGKKFEVLFSQELL